jgi:hypothetical protein
MPIVQGQYKTGTGPLTLSVIIGDAQPATSIASVMDPTAHTTVPVQLPAPPSNPVHVPIGDGPALAGKVLILTTTVAAGNSATLFTSATAVLSGGPGGDQSFSQSPVKASGPGATVLYVFVIGLT